MLRWHPVKNCNYIVKKEASTFHRHTSIAQKIAA